jgi:hypothetical protein
VRPAEGNNGLKDGGAARRPPTEGQRRRAPTVEKDCTDKTESIQVAGHLAARRWLISRATGMGCWFPEPKENPMPSVPVRAPSRPLSHLLSDLLRAWLAPHAAPRSKAATVTRGASRGMPPAASPLARRAESQAALHRVSPGASPGASLRASLRASLPAPLSAPLLASYRAFHPAPHLVSGPDAHAVPLRRPARPLATPLGRPPAPPLARLGGPDRYAGFDVPTYQRRAMRIAGLPAD